MPQEAGTQGRGGKIQTPQSTSGPSLTSTKAFFRPVLSPSKDPVSERSGACGRSVSVRDGPSRQAKELLPPADWPF